MKRALAYLLVVLVSIAAIVVVLRVGAATLPPEPNAPVAVASDASLWDALHQAIGVNLGTPLAHLFVQFLVIIVAVQFFGRVFTQLGFPAVIGEMMAGIFLGPSLFGLLAPGAFAFVFPAQSLGTLQMLAQIGVCLFMFVIGMEVNMNHLRSKAASAVAVSHASIVVPFLMGVTLAMFLYADMAGPTATFTSFALFMGISMSITAFPVLARILQDRGITNTPLGSLALTCAAVDDVSAWTIMAFVVAISSANGLGGVVVTLALVAIFVVVMVFGVRHLLPRLIDKRELSEGEASHGTLALVLWVIVASAFFTESIGIHALFGAFLAGTIMPSSAAFRKHLGNRIEKFSSVLLLPLFFVFTGLRTRVDLLNDLSSVLLCLLIIAVATAGKLGASAVAARMTGNGWRESLQIGALMNTRGLVELIALNIGYDMGILSPRIFTMLVIMALTTTIMTGPLLTLFGEKSRHNVGQAQPSRR